MQEVCRVRLPSYAARGGPVSATHLHAKMSPRQICSDFFHFPSYKCVAWSADNLIAYSATDTSLQGQEFLTAMQNPRASGFIKQTLYIASANSPEEHVALTTQHRSPIKFIEWAPISLGPLLLTADAHEKVLVWEMKDNISEWEKIKSFDLDGTVGLKWLNADPKYALPMTATKAATPAISASPARSLEEKFMSTAARGSQQSSSDKPLAPAGVPCFLHIAASGIVHVIYKKMFDERWGVISPPSRLHNGDFVISHADITRNSAGSIVIAAAGSFSHIGQAICLFELSIDLTKNTTCSSRMISSISLNPLVIGPDVPQPSVLTHLSFDPSSYGKALLTVSSGSTKGSKSVLTRWEYKSSIAPLSSAWAEISTTAAASVASSTSDSSLSPAVQIATPPPITPTSTLNSSNNLPTATGWQYIEAIADISSPENAMEMETADVELLGSISNSFVTALYHAAGLVFVGYVGGSLEIRDSAALQVLHTISAESASSSGEAPRKEEIPNLRSSEDLLKHVANVLSKSSEHNILRSSSSSTLARTKGSAAEDRPTIDESRFPLAFCLSPNEACLATVNSAGTLSIYQLGSLPLKALPSGGHDQEQVVKHVADMLELSIVRTYDWWDLLVWLLLGPFAGETRRKIVAQVVADTSSLDAMAQRSLGKQIEILKTALFHFMGGAETLAVDGVARQTIGYLHDFLTSVLDVDPKATAQLENLASGGLQPILQKFPKTDNQTLDAVEGLAEWALDFLVFFQKNVHHFVNSDINQYLDQATLAEKKASPPTPTPASAPLQTSYNLASSLLALPPSSPLCRRLPMASLMLDRKVLESLRRVAGYAAFIMYHLHQRQQTQTTPSAEGSAGASATSTSAGSSTFSSLPYSPKDTHILYTFVSTLIATHANVAQKAPGSPLEALASLHAALHGPGQQALDVSSFSGSKHEPRVLVRRLSLLPPPSGLLHVVKTQQKDEAVKVESSDVNKTTSQKVMKGTSSSSSTLQQRLQGRYDVVTGVALDPLRLSFVRQCTRCQRVTGWQGSATTGTTGDTAPQPLPLALASGPQGFPRFAVSAFCCPLCGGRWRKLSFPASAAANTHAPASSST